MKKEITCGRCKSQFIYETPDTQSVIEQPLVRCDLCGYSAKDVMENQQKHKKVLKD